MICTQFKVNVLNLISRYQQPVDIKYRFKKAFSLGLLIQFFTNKSQYVFITIILYTECVLYYKDFT